jgi:glycine/D-amino acid oxidase-like deaminating enzyme
VARITVLGAGVCGLATGMLLARDGHDVTVLERDAASVPKSPHEDWESWTRGGVAQFRQPHYLHPEPATSWTPSCRTSAMPSWPPARSASTR